MLNEMKFRLNCLVSFLWYFKRLSLPCQADVHIIRNESWSLVKIANIFVKNPTCLTFYEKMGFMVVATKDEKGSIYRFGSDIFQSLRMAILDTGYNDPKEPQIVPDGVFTFPAISIADGEFSNKDAHGEVKVINFGDFTDITAVDITSNPMVESRYELEYGNPVWLSNDKFLVCRANSIIRFALLTWELMLYKKQEVETGRWKGFVVEEDSACRFPMVLYKNVWNSFDALYSINFMDGSLNLIWAETRNRKPGDWLKRNEIRRSVVDTNEGFMDIKLVDLNNDGKIDLLLSLASHQGEIRAYRIPISGDFRNLKKYKAFKLHSHFKPSREGMCPHALKTFHPFSGIKGKPWILYSGGTCGTAGYLYPESEDYHNWSYGMNLIVKVSYWVCGIEAADINLDGVVEIFVSMFGENVVSVYSFGESSLVSNLTVTFLNRLKESGIERGSLVPEVIVGEMQIFNSEGSTFLGFSSCKSFYIFLICFTSRFFV